MSKVTISLSEDVPAFKKGQRVLVQIKKNEWYLGRVDMFTGTKLNIEYDEKDTSSLLYAEDFKRVTVIPKNVRRNPNKLTKEQVQVILYSASQPDLSEEALRMDVSKTVASLRTSLDCMRVDIERALDSISHIDDEYVKGIDTRALKASVAKLHAADVGIASLVKEVLPVRRILAKATVQLV